MFDVIQLTIKPKNIIPFSQEDIQLHLNLYFIIMKDLNCKAINLKLIIIAQASALPLEGYRPKETASKIILNFFILLILTLKKLRMLRILN